jgi:hypothetical protein
MWDSAASRICAPLLPLLVDTRGKSAGIVSRKYGRTDHS